ncbi:MAG: CoA-binding protein [Acidobacteria bacterium]|nr:CoA-binding protein [Acidobacteriota bacterium]
MDWKSNLLTSRESITELLRDTKRIAVLGIKPETHAGQPAFYVPKYMASVGYEIIPVPVYYPEISVILGQPVFRKLTKILGDVDMVNVFRRPQDISHHVDDILAKRPRSVWLQLGISNDEVAQQLAREGMKVVQNLCIMVEHRYLIPSAN